MFIPPIIQTAQESKPVDQVNFIRDEVANMCWGIESIILTIEVGEFAAPKEYQLIVKKMMAKIYKDVKDHGMVDRFVRDNKYR